MCAGPADGADGGLCLTTTLIGRNRAGFGRTIHLYHRNAAPIHGLQYLQRHIRGAGVQQTQRREVCALPFGQGHQGLHHSGHTNGGGDPRLRQTLDHVAGVERRLQSDGGPDEKGGHHLDIDPAHMKERQDVQNMIFCREIVGVQTDERIPQNSLLRQHRAFRPARGARGIQHHTS